MCAFIPDGRQSEPGFVSQHFSNRNDRNEHLTPLSAGSVSFRMLARIESATRHDGKHFDVSTSCVLIRTGCMLISSL